MQTNSISFAFIKDGVYYFSRRVPADLRSQYATDRISFSLRTRSPREAEARSVAFAARLDEFWFGMRMNAVQVPGKHRLLSDQDKARPPSPTLTEAKAIYLQLKGTGRTKTFHMGADRAVDYVVASCGDKPLLAYEKSDATTFRDDLFKRGLSSSSVERVLSNVRAMVSFVLAEKGISAPNPFTGVYLDRTVSALARQPISPNDLVKVQVKCHEIDDDLRWLIALISDTGMRLAEAAGLSRGDIILDAEIPHVIIRPQPWRSLKTKASSRAVPLVGASLWAAQRVMSTAGGPQAFSRYNKTDRTNANSASAALNKWLTDYVEAGCVIHSFRHSLRDRLRSVQCPTDIVDQIGGWTTVGDGQSYGNGYPLSVLHQWLLQL